MRIVLILLLSFALTSACSGTDPDPVPGTGGAGGIGAGGEGGQGGTGGEPVAICGNGIVEDGEDCDEGAQNSDTLPNRCRENCKLPRCGDGVLDEGEVCSPGEMATCVELREGLDGTATCNQACTWDVSDCWRPEKCRGEDGVADCDDPRCAKLPEYCPTCGDGKATADEACDGEDFRGETCIDHGFALGPLVCADDCKSVSTEACTFCGNATIEEGEECDLSNMNGESCRSLGFVSGTLSCSATCTFDTSRCVEPTCGDGLVEGFEECDGENLAGKSCLDFGFRGGKLGCDACRIDTSACSETDVCGDGILGDDEECDDGNALAGDGCGWSCLLEEGVCGASIVDLNQLLTSGPDGPEYSGTLVGAGADSQNSCQSTSGVDRVHALFVEERSLIRIAVQSLEPEGTMPFSLAVRTDCAQASTELACGGSVNGMSKVEVPVEAGTQLYLVVDADEPAAEGGEYRLVIDAAPMVGLGESCGEEARCEPPFTCAISGVCKDCTDDPFCL